MAQPGPDRNAEIEIRHASCAILLASGLGSCMLSLRVTLDPTPSRSSRTAVRYEASRIAKRCPEAREVNDGSKKEKEKGEESGPQGHSSRQKAEACRQAACTPQGPQGGPQGPPRPPPREEKGPQGGPQGQEGSPPREKEGGPEGGPQGSPPPPRKEGDVRNDGRRTGRDHVLAPILSFGSGGRRRETPPAVFLWASGSGGRSAGVVTCGYFGGAPHSGGQASSPPSRSR